MAESYLHIKFRPELLNSWVAKYITNPRLVLLLIFTIITVGLYSFFTLPRTLNPDINIPIVIVSTALPGAGPSDVEKLVTIPLENALTGVARVKTMISNSQESVSIINLQFESGVDPDKALSDSQAAVNTVTTLPKDAKAPNVKKLDFTNAPVWTFTLTSQSDTGSLMRYAKDLQDRIKKLSSVNDATLAGLEDQEIQIRLKPEAITTYNLSPLQLSQLISASLKAYPAGNIQAHMSNFSVSVDQPVLSVADIRKQSIQIGDQTVSIGSIADVVEAAKPGQNMSFLATKTFAPKEGVTVSVFKTHDANIDKTYSDVKKLIDSEKPIQSGPFHLYSVVNTSERINIQFGDLTRDLLITVFLVFAVLFLFLGIRQALVASFAIPLTFFISFAVMLITHISLSFLSLFSLLLALGLLVDDTIVVASAMTAYFRTGRFTPVQTGLLVWQDFMVAILTTTITTVWAFFPLLLSSGIIGEFIKSIPIVVSTTLIASFFVAMFITLPVIVFILQGNLPRRVKIFLTIVSVSLALLVGIVLLPKSRLFGIEFLLFLVFATVTFLVRRALWDRVSSWFRQRVSMSTKKRERLTGGIIHFTVISDRYHTLITRILESKRGRRLTILMVIIFSIFSYLLLPLGLVKNEFFPKSEEDFVYMNLEFPVGANQQMVTEQTLSVLNTIRRYPDTAFVTADIGQALSENGVGGTGGNTVLFTLELVPKDKRHTSSLVIGQKLRDDFANYTKGKIAVTESTGGPPAGSDVQIKLFGDNLTVLNTYADKVQAYLQKQPGVVNIDKSIKPGTSKLAFVVDPQKIAVSGLTVDTVGLWLRMYVSGMPIESVNFSGPPTQKEDITIRMQQGLGTPEGITTLTLTQQKGSPVPLTSLGDFALESNPTLITREGGERTISVTASVKPGYSVSTINANLGKYADDGLALPTGYHWTTGGVNEQNQQSVQSILQAMLLSFLLIVVTMVIQFASFRRALIVMLVIPLSISGVFVLFALTQTPLSFPALIGVLALFGIVVKNSILMVDKIVQNTKLGMALIPALADASSSRLEPIALTSFAAIFGLIPITLSDPIWRGLGGAIIAGLTFSGTIMLFFIPVVYYYWFAPTQERKQRKR